MCTTTTVLTELQAIDLSKEKLKTLSDIFTMSNMTKKDCEDYIWSYLYDTGKQYLKPIDYVKNGIDYVILIHEE